jgi:hypothetical protein
LPVSHSARAIHNCLAQIASLVHTVHTPFLESLAIS